MARGFSTGEDFPFKQYEYFPGTDVIKYRAVSDKTGNTAKPEWIIERFYYDGGMTMVLSSITKSYAVYDDRDSLFP